MKKLLTCFFAIMVVAPGAVVASGGFSRALPGTQTKDTSSDNTKQILSRTQPSTPKKEDISRSAIVRTTTTDKSAQTRIPDTQSKNKTVSRAVDINIARSNLEETMKTVGRNTRVSAASINSNPTVRRAGVVLRPSTAEVGGRATLGDSGIQTGSNIGNEIQNIKSRASQKISAESIAEAQTRLEQTATLNKSCQEQYNDCMDQFCAIVDANQKRCSCSANLAQYTKVEEAVKNANTQLNDVAQRIRYVGLSADEIRAIMEETEAEEVLSKSNDVSETRDMLQAIEDMIRDPVSVTTTYSENTSFGNLDLNFDLNADFSDLSSLDLFNSDSTGSFSNLRGKQLYNAARSRCNTVLKQCKDAGSTTDQITANYDLAIDKDCIAYEQGLRKMNESLISNVRSANLMLQKARLAVLQNKNLYDAKQCIGALETCMKDDMVCGENYFKCVDPTKTYIDEEGKVILGQDISMIKRFMSAYNNANIDLEAAYNTSISDDSCSKHLDDDEQIKAGGNGSCVIKHLLTKIGTKQNVADEGLCRAVLEKCQMYTYTPDKKYIRFNDIVLNYIQRTMPNIRAAQQNIISEYASTCMAEIASCYNQQITQINSWNTGANVGSIRSIMRGACRNVALTCAYAIYNTGTSTDTGTTNYCDSPDECIDNISEMFYQSLLCPDNSTYNATSKTTAEQKDNYVNEHCICNDGFEPSGKSCVIISDNTEQTE